jgi:triacylglycerol lipase
MRIVMIAILLTLLAVPAASAQRPSHADSTRTRELVVLVHGMGRTPISMLPLAWTLKRAGYQVMNWGYSSTCCTVAEIGTQLSSALKKIDYGSVDRVHFVGHSLGTVIIRWALANNTRLDKRGHVVMLAPPNQGSSRADRAAMRWAWVLKPLPELITATGSTARTIPFPTNVKIGVIAGEFDGKVSVAETHIEGEAGHVVVPAHHSFLMLRKDVRDLTIKFLQTGTFGGARSAHGDQQ